MFTQRMASKILARSGDVNQVIQGDCLEVMRGIEAKSVDMVFTKMCRCSRQRNNQREKQNYTHERRRLFLYIYIKDIKVFKI